MAEVRTKVELNRTVSLAPKRDTLHHNKKMEDARAAVTRAERKTKPSVKRWKPRFSVAGDEYCQAALLFYGAGEVEESKINLLKACDCFKKKRSWYSAAKTLEQAMTITQKQGDYTSMTELAWRSAALFRKAGQPDSAAQLLERAASALGNRQPENSVLMLEKAAETVETENRPIQAANYVARLLRLALDKRDHDEAIDKARKLVELYQEAGHKPSTGRNVLGLVILLLHVHKTGEAEVVAREFGNNCSRDQNVLIEDLLDAYDQNDLNKVQGTLKSKVLSSLDVEFRPILDGMSLPARFANDGIRPRSRTRRIFSVYKDSSDDKGKDDTSTAAATTTASSRCTTDDEKEKRNNANDGSGDEVAAPGAVDMKIKAAKKAPLYKGEDLKLDDEKQSKKKDEEEKKVHRRSHRHRSGDDHQPRSDDKSSPTKSHKKRNPLMKMATHDETSPKKKGSPSKQQPSAYIDVTTDSLNRHRPGHLPAPAVYVDVEGIDAVQPAYMGMTVEQWRAFKRSTQADETEYAMEDTLADIGEGGDW